VTTDIKTPAGLVRVSVAQMVKNAPLADDKILVAVELNQQVIYKKVFAGRLSD
jgi:hypothetical protein